MNLASEVYLSSQHLSPNFQVYCLILKAFPTPIKANGVRYFWHCSQLYMGGGSLLKNCPCVASCL